MRVRLWDPFTEMDALRGAIDSLFSEFVERPGLAWSGRPAMRMPSAPSLNMSEDPENVYVEMLAPGIDPEKLEVTVQDGVLRIAGEKPALSQEIKREAFHRKERGYGAFTRAINLPGKVNQEKAKAEFQNGILRLTLPKAEEAKPKQITVAIN